MVASHQYTVPLASVYPRKRSNSLANLSSAPLLLGSQGITALTGQVNYLDGYIVGRQQVIQFYSRLDRAYPEVDLIYVIQDNWNIHTHPDVLTALVDYPRIKPVWLPTYAPWLNPIEKLWRWVRQDVLKMHRWVEDWPQVKQRVPHFLAQFAHGSAALLRYVGLKGKGKLATVINTS